MSSDQNKGSSKDATASAINIEEALTNMAGDEALLQEVIQILIDNMPKMLEELRKAAVSGNQTDLEIQAHGLKGAAANVSAHRIRDIAARLESAGAHSEADEVRIMLDDLDDRVTELFEFAAAYHRNQGN